MCLVAQRVKHLPTMRETRVQSLGWEDPLEKEMEPTPELLPGKPHGLRSLVGYSPWGLKESDTTERLHFTSHKEMTFCCHSCFCWGEGSILNFSCLKYRVVEVG